MTIHRRAASYDARVSAAEAARERTHPTHRANGDEQKYSCANFAMSLTKGLAHDPNTGCVENPQHFTAFRTAINDGFIDAFNTRVPVPPFAGENTFARRQWEAPTAGIVYDLEGPDAQAVTMAPAPPLLSAAGIANPELILEMGEVYELAILRDQPFNSFEEGQNDPDILASINRLNALEYIANYTEQNGRPRIRSEEHTF